VTPDKERVRLLRDLQGHKMPCDVVCKGTPALDVAIILGMIEDGWITGHPFPPGADSYAMIRVTGINEAGYAALRAAKPRVKIAGVLKSPVFWVALSVVVAIVFGVIQCGKDKHAPASQHDPATSIQLSPKSEAPSSTQAPQTTAPSSEESTATAAPSP
jgi:hypothetical protein